MTDTTDTKALRPAERAKLGFVTDDNTGGHYVAECEECGQIFPSQTCDGGEQIADSGDYGDCYCPHCGFIDPLECDNANLVWNVQQLKIVNLTKQLEAERQRAADLVLHVNTQANMRDKAEAELASVTKHRDEIERFRVAVCKDKDNLIDTCIARDREIAALKTKINKPVVPPRVEGLLKQWQFERDCEWKAAIEAAGGVVKDGD